MSGICLDDALHWSWFHCLNTAKAKIKLQPQVITCMQRSLPKQKTSHNPSNRMFYSVSQYDWYIPDIFMSYLLSSTLAGSSSRWGVSDLASHRIFSVFATERPCNSRMVTAKNPQPGVDLINMAPVPAWWCRSWTVSTPEFEVLLLRAAYLNGMVEEVLSSRKQGKSGTNTDE